MATVEAKIRAQLIDEASGKAQKIAATLGAVEKAAGGAGAAGARLAELAAAEREAEVAAERAAAAQRELAKASGASVADVRALSKAAREAAAAEEDLAQAGAAAGAGANPAAAGAKKVTDASKAQGRALAEQVNFITEVGLGFGMLSPATQQASLAFASAGNNAFALANALGPIGPLIAIGIGAATAAAGAWARYGQSTREAAKAAREAREAFLGQVDAAQQAAAAEQRLRELRRGDRSVEEQEAALKVAQDAARARRQEVDTLTTRQVGERSLLARAAGVFGGNAGRRLAAQAQGADVARLADLAASAGRIGATLSGGSMVDAGRVGATLTGGPMPDSALGTRAFEQQLGARRTALSEATREETTLTRARDRAQTRENREAEQARLRQQVEGASALQASLDADIRRRFGAGARGQQQADALISSLGSARLDSSDRVVLDAAGSRAARGLSEADRAAVLGRAEETLQAQRRAAAAEEAMRQEAIRAVLATNTGERGASPTARPDLALREGGELSQLLTRYIEADRGDPQAQVRAIEALARAAESLERMAREGTSVRVSVDGQGGGGGAPISFAGAGTSGR